MVDLQVVAHAVRLRNFPHTAQGRRVTEVPYFNSKEHKITPCMQRVERLY